MKQLSRLKDCPIDKYYMLELSYGQTFYCSPYDGGVKSWHRTLSDLYFQKDIVNIYQFNTGREMHEFVNKKKLASKLCQ